MKQLKFSNYSMYSSMKKGSKWYEWCVFIDEPKEVIDSVAQVTYLLHPSFYNPLKKISTRDNKFALYSNGWGEFNIKIKVAFKDLSTSTTEYYLKLKDDNWPKGEIGHNNLNPEEVQIINAFINSDFKWRKIETINSLIKLDEKAFSNHLNSLVAKNLIRKYPFQSIDGANLYGATNKIGIEPKLFNTKFE